MVRTDNMQRSEESVERKVNSTLQRKYQKEHKRYAFLFNHLVNQSFRASKAMIQAERIKDQNKSSWYF